MADTPQSLSFNLQAEAISLSDVRERVTTWLEGVDWPVRDQGAAIMVVNEAVTNSIEHGFGTALQRDRAGDCVWVQVCVVPSDADSRRLVIAIEDNGGWKQPTDRRAVDHLGLLLMGKLGDDLWIDARAGGTTLVFTGNAQQAR